MTTVLEHTGSTLGDYEELTAPDEQLGSRHTQAQNISSLNLRLLLAGFDSALDEPMAPLRSFLATHPDATGASISNEGADRSEGSAAGLLRTPMPPLFRVPTSVATTDLTLKADPQRLPGITEPGLTYSAEDAVVAVKDLSWRLGLPQRDICKAAGVSRSAYYSWNQSDAPRPRVASQGRLWALVQFAEDLEDLLDVPPAHWLLASPRQRDQLLDGRFDDLLESLRTQPRPRKAAPDHARFLSVGGDRLASDDEPSTLRRNSRNPTSAQPVNRPRSREK